jgi:hypothetical protein
MALSSCGAPRPLRRHPMSRLFERLSLGPPTLANRIVVAPMFR